MEASKRGPDPPHVLEATWRALIEAVRTPGERLVVGGRSMGGRIASQVVAQGGEVDALALFAYPLHPPGRPLQLRDQHLPAIKGADLFCPALTMRSPRRTSLVPPRPKYGCLPSIC
jgi:predicted alpha/beta-hydrolase family hydrolase